MLRRFWFLVSAVWALCVLGADAAGNVVTAKSFVIALAPFVIGFLIAKGARFVFTGSFAKPAAPRL